MPQFPDEQSLAAAVRADAEYQGFDVQEVDLIPVRGNQVKILVTTDAGQSDLQSVAIRREDGYEIA